MSLFSFLFSISSLMLSSLKSKKLRLILINLLFNFSGAISLGILRSKLNKEFISFISLLVLFITFSSFNNKSMFNQTSFKSRSKYIISFDFN